MRELGQLLPAQPRYPAQAPVVRQARPARVEGGAARAQEVAQLIALRSRSPGHSPAIMPIPGTTGIAHLRENLDTQDLELSPEDIRSTTELAPEGAAA
ncbi:hypothetical protein OIE62_33875 [Streptomyces scopuliridis]|uniref:Uncharacterized protein n=1 Tax=Streptomyces scopuliridis TaxID=452529 RepID=A0ACD4ZF19_9ACTN|nr:hypothetical protein [Streptomyces scopuliridis]WSB96780.1 hypothetical protein OG835_07060 [Streptomyces scopuliridis]WSC09516.1 hypothetical protein OIE62_33875 [Streptomyces scopuliridis]